MAAQEKTPRRHYAVIVAGSGSAGMFAALEARKAGPVLLVTKDRLRSSNTWFAQGGMAAALAPGDSVEAHLRDTIAAGAGLVDEAAARVLCEAAPQSIASLQEMGVRFDERDGEVALGREAAHSHDRIIHSGGDRTGQGLIGGLIAAIEASEVDVLEQHFVRSLVGSRERVEGIDVLTPGGEHTRYGADAVILATGGAGQVYSHTTNPPVATGDGIALAFEAGAELADLEFFQFHPTAFFGEGGEPFLISEAVRGEGAVLRNAAGEAFMARYTEDRELAPRDIVARAIASEMKATGARNAWLDCTGITHVDVRERFPGITRFCDAAGIDIRRDRIPVAPAAHYLMGGVRTDTRARTTVPGLYACGEVACTGVHGANRLASNSLVETVVFAQRAAAHILSAEGGAADPAREAVTTAAGLRTPPDRAVLQSLMWEAGGIERTGEQMKTALRSIGKWPAGAPGTTIHELESRNLATAGELMMEAALRREESRGAHFRSDFPARDDKHWKKRQVFRRGD